MRPHNGLIVVDNSALAFLRDDEAFAALESNCRVADLTVHVSAINVLEAASTPDEATSRKLRDLLLRLGGAQLLLPPPDELLRRAAAQVLGGESSFETDITGYEWMLHDDNSRKSRQAELLKLCKSTEEAFATFHEKVRPEVRKTLRNAGLTDLVQTAADFLDWFWTRSDDLPSAIAALMWNHLGILEPFPGAPLLANNLWRLLLDGEAVALYERAVASKQFKAVHQLDIWQLIYLAGGERRILISADGALLRVGNTVVQGRYPCARVLHPTKFLGFAAT